MRPWWVGGRTGQESRPSARTRPGGPQDRSWFRILKPRPWWREGQQELLG